MYNNSNGSVEDSDAAPSQKETDPQTDLTESKNVADEPDENPESERKEDSISVKEVEATEQTQDSVAASELNNTNESVPKPVEDHDNKNENIELPKTPEDENANTEPSEKMNNDAPSVDASEVEPKENELPDASKDEGETLEEVKDESEQQEEPLTEQRKDRGPPVNLDLCRVCMRTEDLSDIFQLEGSVRVSDIIMKVCTNIRITARDHLPHKICERCLEQVRIVNEFKIRCEASDKELRKNLKRSTNKTRRQVIVVNCPMSDSENEDEPVDDDEYQVSQSEEESEPATSDDSFSPPNKRKRTPKKRGRKPAQYKTPGRRGRPGRKPKHMAIETPNTATPVLKRRPGRPPKNQTAPSLSNIVYIEAPEDSTSSDEVGEQKKRRRKRGDNPCPKCDEVLPTQVALKQHLKTHPEDVFNCDRCTLWFRTQQALTNHIERHKKADRLREEKRKERERRQNQMQREQRRSSDIEDMKRISQISATAEKKKKTDLVPASSGRDLFKCVAPLTSTYWSDSFSE